MTHARPNYNASARILGVIIELSLADGRLTVAELLERLDISRRTIVRYIELLSRITDDDGVPIVELMHARALDDAVVELRWLPVRGGMQRLVFETPAPAPREGLEPSHFLTAWGETRPLVRWAEDDRCPVSRFTLMLRFERGDGWTHEEMIATPPYQRPARLEGRHVA